MGNFDRRNSKKMQRRRAQEKKKGRIKARAVAVKAERKPAPRKGK